MSQPNYETIASTVKQIRRALAELVQYRTQPSHYDKVGFCINRDPRFSAVKLEISIDTWVGTYGNSSCGRILGIPDTNTFKSAFIAVLDDELLSLLEKTADRMETTCGDALRKHIADTEAKLAGLKAAEEKLGAAEEVQESE